MKHPLEAALCGAAIALCLACGGQGSEPTVNVNGVSDLAQAGTLLFVTGTDANELRVFDLTQSPPKFVPAPNPLHPLSIPVVDRPVQLVSDVSWDTGAPVGGHFVFARSADGREISVVGAAPEVLRELARITSVSEEITSLAARSLPDSDPANAAILYVATFDGTFAHVRAVPIPKDASTLNQTTCRNAQGSVPTDTSSSDPRVVPGCLPSTELIPPINLGCSVIEALTVMPGDTAGHPRLAYSVRRTAQLESTCLAGMDPQATATEGARLRREASFLVDLQDGTQTLLDFGGPVRRLVPSPGYVKNASQDNPVTVPAAARIFGVLDEEACGPGIRCHGVVAVDGVEQPGVTTAPRDPATFPCGGGVGHYACDVSGLPMIPVDPGTPIIMGLDVGPGAIHLPQCSEPPTGRDLVGVISRSDGFLQFFDAVNLREFNTFFADTQTCAELAGVGDVFKINPDGSTSAPEANVITGAQATFGATRDEDIKLTFQGTLPGFNHLPAPAPGAQALTVTTDPAGRVQVGDELVVDPSETCTESGALAKVTAVTAGTGQWTLQLNQAPVVPSGCTVSLRPADQWVATGTVSGFLGRFSPPAQGATETVALPVDEAARPGRYFYHKTDLPLPLPPQLTFVFNPPAEVPTYTSYVIPTAAHFAPVLVSIDPSLRSANLQFVAVAGPVQYQAGTQNILVSYPSSDEVIQINTAAVNPGARITTYNALP